MTAQKILVVLFLALATVFFGSLFREERASGSGGVYTQTAHSNATTGVDRSSVDSSYSIYAKGECAHCHEAHASFGGSEPAPVGGGPSEYLLATYGSLASEKKALCYLCHTAASGDWPGQTDYDLSAHGGGSFTEANPVNSKNLPECLACHNPHGEADPTGGAPYDKMLVKWSYGSGANSSDEEFLCYGGSSSSGACHAIGSSKDIETAFSGTITATSAGGALLNTHHDIYYADQQYSGAKIECHICHNPHSATTTDKVVADPDTTDSRTPAAGNTWVDSTLLSEWCLDCHDNSFPSSVTPPTNALTDIYYLWTDSKKGDQHGAAAGSTNPNLRAGSGYARYDILQCSDCHVLGHGSSNLFQLKTTIYSKDGTTALISDAGTYTVELTNIDDNNADALTNGKNWCSTCHPDPMGGTKSKGCIGCHHHSDRF